ncbi:unnamed protein product [Trichobilharzia regenti]|nr:unnamed protein product [Trichobilharzia regenti]
MRSCLCYRVLFLEEVDEDVVKSRRNAYMEFASISSIRYQWFKDSFKLWVQPPCRFLVLINYLPAKGPVSLFGFVDCGECIEDEWVSDEDGEFLLIECANHLPKWLNPENAENRINKLVTTELSKSYVTIPVWFNRLRYARLRSLPTPGGMMQPQSNNTASRRLAAELGLKLCIGLDLLLNNVNSHTQNSQFTPDFLIPSESKEKWGVFVERLTSIGYFQVISFYFSLICLLCV